MTTFGHHKIELDLDEAVATFDCVAGVLYQDTEVRILSKTAI